MMKNPKFQIFAGKNEKFYFRLNARNGQQVLSSQGFPEKSGCENEIATVKANVADNGRFLKKTAKNGKFYFSLTAPDGDIIGSSQMYKSESGRNNGIAAVQRIAADAPVEDITE